MALPLIYSLQDEIPSGAWMGVSDLRVPLWKLAENIDWTGLGVSKMSGWSEAFTSPSAIAITGLAQDISNGVQYLWFGTDTNLYRWNTATAVSQGSGYNGIANATATQPATRWSIQTYGTYTLATNGVDQPQLSSALGAFANLGADFTTAEILAKVGPHILALNTSINPRGFVWCSADDPTDWTPTSENSAGDLIIRELDSNIVAAARLGEGLAVYGKDQMFIVGYTGQPFYFGYKHALDGFGAVSKNSVISIGRMNFGLGRQGFWQTDGSQFKYIDQPQVRNYIQTDINWAQASKVCGYHDEDNHRIIWYYPSVAGAGAVDKGIAYDYQRQLWSTFDHGFTAALPRDVFSYPVAGEVDGDIHFLQVGTNANTSALSARLTTRAVDMGETELVKMLSRLRVDMQGTGLEFRVGHQINLDDAVVWTDWTALTAGNLKNDLRVTGRYLTLDFRSTELGDAWELWGIFAYGRVGGKR